MPDADDAREEIHEPDAPAAVVADEVAAAIVAEHPGTVFHESHGQPVVYVDRSSWHEVAAHLRDAQQFTMCVDVTVVDHLRDDTRLEIASITDLYPGANFAEREAYDLLGVTFEGHPDLTRILMPDDWVGHPLRKDDHPARVPVTFKEDPSPR